MKTLFIECAMGAAGDMLMASLLELSSDRNAFLAKINSLGLDHVHLHAEESVKCGINGTHVSVHIGDLEEDSVDVDIHEHASGHEHHEHTHDHVHIHVHEHEQEDHTHDHDHTHEHDHSHGSLDDITRIITGLPISESAKTHASAVYTLLAEAEASVHGRPVSDVHFHEVGRLDAITDIVGVCLLMEELSPEEVVVSPVNVGSGFVRCAHGVLPVPAPATAHILRGIPFYSGKLVSGELCTPTGAALLKHFATRFGTMPEMTVQKIGYGMGKKDFEVCNCVRTFLGGSETKAEGPNGQIAELRCNIDDMTGEAIGYACRLLFSEGARDVFTVPTDMKKDRPGVLLVCVCDVPEADRFASLLLQNTSTFGVRKTVCDRYMLSREITTVETPYGAIRVKTGRGYGAEKAKAEYEDIAAAANRAGVPFAQVESAVRASNK